MLNNWPSRLTFIIDQHDLAERGVNVKEIYLFIHKGKPYISIHHIYICKKAKTAVN